ncbi:aldehyde dehydrogenase family protein [Pseudochelatococcus lubricantis]|uniref:aldehyde dehydrogenase family protein n=1 Tax=Pseudochelatococcus lubricantis TaxID=1538102 RepID=UPI0035EB87D9
MINRLQPSVTERLRLPINRGLYYGGSWHEPEDGVYVETRSPASGESLGETAWADSVDVDHAVEAAREGFRVWRETTPVARGALLREAARLVRQHAEELALLDAADCGNPIREMIKDAEIGATALEYFAGLATEVKGYTVPLGPDHLNFTIREPLGVIARINAYNHPFMFAVSRAGAPLAAGNALIIKSPEQAPLSSLRLAELIGPLFPPGVFNVVSGGRTCGEALVAHPHIAKVGLIGSVPTGKAILRGAVDSMKKVTLELGGKNALIAYPDADPDKVAVGAVRGMNFSWCGQSCGSTSRVFLHDSIHDAVLDAIVEQVKAFVPGIPTDPATTMGSLVSEAQFNKVMRFITLGQSEGARLVTGGNSADDPHLGNGYFIKPTVFADVTPAMRLAREEIFGPVLSVFKWSDEVEMLRAVNDVDYGLTASIWTQDINKALRTATQVEAGYIWINGSGKHFVGTPFGGCKQSGLGREESIEELLDCTQLKNVNISLE